MLYCYNLNGQYQNINLITNSRFLAEHDSCLSTGWISNENELICSFYGKVIKHDKSFANSTIYDL